jgi:hypothetical protein
MPDLAPALAVALEHERRRHNPLPPLRDLTDDAALAIVCEEERRRAQSTRRALTEHAAQT